MPIFNYFLQENSSVDYEGSQTVLVENLEEQLRNIVPPKKRGPKPKKIEEPTFTEVKSR